MFVLISVLSILTIIVAAIALGNRGIQNDIKAFDSTSAENNIDEKQPPKENDTQHDHFVWEEKNGEWRLVCHAEDGEIFESYAKSEFKRVVEGEITGIRYFIRIDYNLAKFYNDQIAAPAAGILHFIGGNGAKNGTCIATISMSPKAEEEMAVWLKEEQKKREMQEALKAKQEIEAEKAEIARKIKEKHRRRELEKIVRQELIDSGELFGDAPKRPPIPREVVDAVYRRDGGRCVYCGSTENLQLDHIIPFSKGGASTVENLQLLCAKCNREKSDHIG